MQAKRLNMKELFEDIGYNGATDFFHSVFHVDSAKVIAVVSAFFGVIATFIERFIGLEPVVYLAFLLLLAMEFYTGIKASLKEGRKIESKKFGRFIFKIASYSLIIGIVNIFRTEFHVPSIAGMEVNVWHFIYYTSLNMVIIQLVISVFENLSRLGFRETNLVFKAVANKVGKYINLEENKKED
jgi:hypothetical protein